MEETDGHNRTEQTRKERQKSNPRKRPPKSTIHNHIHQNPPILPCVTTSASTRTPPPESTIHQIRFHQLQASVRKWRHLSLNVSCLHSSPHLLSPAISLGMEKATSYPTLRPEFAFTNSCTQSESVLSASITTSAFTSDFTGITRDTTHAMVQDVIAM